MTAWVEPNSDAVSGSVVPIMARANFSTKLTKHMNKTLLAVLIAVARAAYAQDTKPGVTTVKEVTVAATRFVADMHTVSAKPVVGTDDVTRSH